jgi:hypothetical protein
MRVILIWLVLMSASLPAFGDDWASRSGTCFETQDYRASLSHGGLASTVCGTPPWRRIGSRSFWKD